MTIHWELFLYIVLLVFEVALITTLKVYLHNKLGYNRETYLVFEYGTVYGMTYVLLLCLIIIVGVSGWYVVVIVAFAALLEMLILYRKYYELEKMMKYFLFVGSTSLVSYVIVQWFTKLVLLIIE